MTPRRQDGDLGSDTLPRAYTVADAASLLATTPDIVVRLVLRGRVACGAVLPTDVIALQALRLEATRLAMEIDTAPELASALEDEMAADLLSTVAGAGVVSAETVRWGDADLPREITPAAFVLPAGQRGWALAAPTVRPGAVWLLAEEVRHTASAQSKAEEAPGAETDQGSHYALRWRLPDQDGRPWLVVVGSGDVVPVAVPDTARALWWVLVDPGEDRDDAEARLTRARGRALLARLRGAVGALMGTGGGS